jgi:hypothetical protein
VRTSACESAAAASGAIRETAKSDGAKAYGETPAEATRASQAKRLQSSERSGARKSSVARRSPPDRRRKPAVEADRLRAATIARREPEAKSRRYWVRWVRASGERASATAIASAAPRISQPRSPLPLPRTS